MIRLKSWFEQITATAVKKGTRFRNGDRPNASTLRDLRDSTVFKAESEDRAKEDTGVYNPDNMGHVTLATDAQVKAYEDKKSDRSLVTQPSQLTEVAEGSDISLENYTGPTITVTKDATEPKRNKFLVNVSNTLMVWLNLFKEAFDDYVIDTADKLVPSGGTTGQQLIKTSNEDYETQWQDPCCNNVVDFELSLAQDIPNDADIVCFYDTSSFSGQARTDAQNLMETWYGNYVSDNPSFLGKLIQLERSVEDWLNFANVYMDSAISLLPHKVWQPDGAGGYTVLSNDPISEPSNKKIVMIVFIDESSFSYHGNIAADMQDPPTVDFREHYNEFVNVQYDKYEFFRSIIYAVQSSGPSGSTANLHSNVVQAIEPSTLASAPFSYSVENAAGFDGTQLDFITTTNFYEEAVDGASPSGYSGLRNYGWAYVVNMPNGSVDSVTNTEFASDIQFALSGGDGNKTITLTGLITLQDGTNFTSSVAFEVPT